MITTHKFTCTYRNVIFDWDPSSVYMPATKCQHVIRYAELHKVELQSNRTTCNLPSSSTLELVHCNWSMWQNYSKNHSKSQKEKKEFLVSFLDWLEVITASLYIQKNHFHIHYDLDKSLSTDRKIVASCHSTLTFTHFWTLTAQSLSLAPTPSSPLTSGLPLRQTWPAAWGWPQPWLAAAAVSVTW